MVARMRDPIDGWGEGQAPMHQVKSTSCTPPVPRDHVGKKRRAYVHDQVRGWGRVMAKVNPRPRQVSHATLRPLIACVRGCPSKILTKHQGNCTC